MSPILFTDSEEALFEKLVEEEKQLDRRIERAEAEYRTKEAGKILEGFIFKEQMQIRKII